MKLLQLLARELREWPEDGGPVVAVVQDPDMMAYVRPHDDADEFAFRQNEWIGVWHNSATARPLSDLATDHATAIVTRAAWQAEKARIAGKVDGGWKRHKRKSQPVSDGAIVEIRTRGGEYETCEASCFSWGATGNSQIMAYRIHKPAEQLAPVSEEAIQVGIDAADAGKLTPIAEVKARIPSLKTERALKDAREGNTAKFSSIDELMQDLGEPMPQPLAWRDRIRTLDTQRAELEEAYQRQIGEIDWERVELVRRLASEGLALVEVVQPVEDMSDWRNWKAGDFLECVDISDKHCAAIQLGELYQYKGFGDVIDDDGDEQAYPVKHGKCFKWHSRPGK